MSDYKQASITKQTAEKIEKLKSVFEKKGTPMQAPTIIGMAINKMVEEIK